MIDTFVTVFGRKPEVKELIILRRLRKLYTEELVAEAIRLSATITEGTPIKYISAVANNLYKESNQAAHSLVEQTKKKLKELEEYGIN